MEETKFEYDVFISYSNTDEAWVVDTLLQFLENAGLKVCIHFRDFPVGRPSIINMQDAAENSRHTILVMTPDWVSREWTLYEGILTRTNDPAGLQRRTIPLMLRKCDVPKFISMLTWVDFTRKDRDAIAWAQLLKACDVEPPKALVVNSGSGELEEQQAISPKLELKLIDNMKRYVNQLAFSQTTNNQDFRFGIALINNIEGSVPAEKLDMTIECSWDGLDIKNAPKFKTDIHNRTTQGWIASKELVQQGEIPYPAKLSFHGTADDRCAYGHSLEWYRFAIVLFERMSGRFVLNYKISSASPGVVTCQGTLFIIIDSKKFGTKTVTLNDILSGEELHIEFNINADEIEINNFRVKRVRELESNENQIVFCPVGEPISKLYHLSREQLEYLKSL